MRVQFKFNQQVIGPNYFRIKLTIESKKKIPSLGTSYYFLLFLFSDNFLTGWFNYTKEMTAAVHDKKFNIIQVLYEDLIMVLLVIF